MDCELKPCPFCGGTARIAFSGYQDCDYWRGFIVAKCDVCGSSSKGTFYWGPPIEFPLTETVGAEKEVKRWNLRRHE